MLSPETLASWGAIAAGVAGGPVFAWRVGGAIAEKIRARNGNGKNGHGHDAAALALLNQIRHEVSDRDGSVRAHGHQVANALQVGIGRLEVMQAQDARVEKYLEKIAETLGAIRLEAAERGNCCEHCK